MKIIPKEAQTTIQWSGGQTTELYIYPENTQYASRDFKFRLSTATVEVETSKFTPLEGIDRTLMVLEGKMELNHIGHHSSTLSPLMTDQFKGEWTTESKGTCIDFNLMCRDGVKGQLVGHRLQQGQSIELSLTGMANYLYLFSGELKINGATIQEGTLVEFDLKDEVELTAIETSLLVDIQITNL